jgi:hypothetical protein
MCEKQAKCNHRELCILNPPGGGVHFLFYCFDLLLIIYEEAYDGPDLESALQRDFPSGRHFGGRCRAWS